MFDYQLDGTIATITMNDSKANAVSSGFLEGMNAALDRAEADKASALILTGREGMFSAGFDLKELQKGGEHQSVLIKGGFELLVRLYEFKKPLLAACDGHAIGMGAFLLMACDTRVGTQGSHKFSLPETAIGMDLNALLVALAKARITKRFLTRVAIQSENLGPDLAVEAGLLDVVVEPAALVATTRGIAEQLAKLSSAYGRNKAYVRSDTLAEMRAYLEQIS